MSGNVQNLSVTEKCIKSYKEVLDFVELCQSDPDQNIINECVIFCDINIALIITLRNTVAKHWWAKSVLLFHNQPDWVSSGWSQFFAAQEGRWTTEQCQMAWIRVCFWILDLYRNHQECQAHRRGGIFWRCKRCFCHRDQEDPGRKKAKFKIYTILEATFAKEKGQNTVEDLKHFRMKTFKVSNLKRAFQHFWFSPGQSIPDATAK